MTQLAARWEDLAVCVGQDPDWWTSEGRQNWPAAVELCLSCPVREHCLEGAVERRDNGVIRAGMWLAERHSRIVVTSLICAHCQVKPVRMTDKLHPTRYCGGGCQTAAWRARRRLA